MNKLLLVFALLVATLNPTVVLAKGMKGNLEAEEMVFIRQTVYPILIDAGICTSAEKDCVGGDFIKCVSFDSLSCDVWGMTDDATIKRIFLAMLNSKLRIKSVNFWRSKYHQSSLFEKPTLSFIDRTDGK